jgi:hypothetical protein
VIEERQGAVDDDASEADIVKAGFIQELRRRGHAPESDAIFIPSQVAAAIVKSATNEQRPVNKASSFLSSLPINELRVSKMDGCRGFCWTGPRSPPEAKMAHIKLDPWELRGS